MRTTLSLAALAALAATCPVLLADGGIHERVSVTTLEEQASDKSRRSTVSADGRHVAFVSLAPDLVAGDTNNAWDVFVRDRLRGTTTRVSVSTGGEQANGECYEPGSQGRGVSISGNGRYVVFHSEAWNLVTGDSNSDWDCFAHDRDPDANGILDEGNGTTALVSVDSSGNQLGAFWSKYPWISANGRYVAFATQAPFDSIDSNGKTDIYVRDRKLGLTRLVSAGLNGTGANDHSDHPVISGNGAYVAYQSAASDLVAGDTNLKTDIFVTTWSNGSTVRASVSSNGDQANDWSQNASISHSGFHIAFSSQATNLHPDDQNEFEDVFAHDLTTGITVPISVRPDGKTANEFSVHASISATGRFVAFESLAWNMTKKSSPVRDIYLFDRLWGTMTWVTDPLFGDGTSGLSHWPTVNGNGRVIGFESDAFNLIPQDTNVTFDAFVRIRHPAWRTPRI